MAGRKKAQDPEKHPRVNDPESAIARLPHAYPFLLLDRVLVLEPGRWVVAVKNVTGNDPFVDACGELPPVLLAEAMAQAAGVAAAPSQGRTAAVLARIDRFRCRGPIVPGDQLMVTVRVVKRFGGTVKAHTAVRVAGRRCAAGELMLHFPQDAERG